MPIINTLPNTIANGQLEDAVPVMANFNWILSQVNGNACPATTGSGILKGNGTGGTTTAVAGTDYAGITSVNTFTQLQSGIAAVAGANFPIASQVQASAFNTGTIGGTADAITAVFAPVFTSLVSAPVWWRATAANATTTPTFKRDGLVAKTIVKGSNQALVAGDIPGAGAWMCSQYDATLDKEVLLNPAYPVSIASATTAQLGVVTKSTQAENAAGTGTGVVASADLPTAVHAMSLGYNQTWTVFTSVTRALGTTYQNLTGKPILIQGVITGSSVLSVDGVAVWNSSTVNYFSLIIPPNSTYVATAGTWVMWNELR